MQRLSRTTRTVPNVAVTVEPLRRGCPAALALSGGRWLRHHHAECLAVGPRGAITYCSAGVVLRGGE